MISASSIIQVLVLIPSLFPVLVHLDNSQRLKRGSDLPIWRWPLWIASGLHLGSYFVGERNDMVILGAMHFISAGLGALALLQELRYTYKFSVRNLAKIVALLGFIMLVYQLVLSSLPDYLYPRPRRIPTRIVQQCIGVIGVVFYALSLFVLPPLRNHDLDTPAGGFHPLSIAIHAAGAFCSVMLTVLVFQYPDFFAVGLYSGVLVADLISIAIYAIGHWYAQNGESSRSYNMIPLREM